MTQRNPEAWFKLVEPPDPTWQRHQWDVLAAAREVKVDLSTLTSANAFLPGANIDVLVTREELEELISSKLRRALAATRDTLNRAGVEATQLAALYLVGGSSRIPLVDRMLTEELGVKPRLLDDPKLVVVNGASCAESGVLEREEDPRPAPPPAREVDEDESLRADAQASDAVGGSPVGAVVLVARVRDDQLDVGLVRRNFDGVELIGRSRSPWQSPARRIVDYWAQTLAAGDPMGWSRLKNPPDDEWGARGEGLAVQAANADALLCAEPVALGWAPGLDVEVMIGHDDLLDIVDGAVTLADAGAEALLRKASLPSPAAWALVDLGPVAVRPSLATTTLYQRLSRHVVPAQGAQGERAAPPVPPAGIMSPQEALELVATRYPHTTDEDRVFARSLDPGMVMGERSTIAPSPGEAALAVCEVVRSMLEPEERLVALLPRATLQRAAMLKMPALAGRRFAVAVTDRRSLLLTWGGQTITSGHRVEGMYPMRGLRADAPQSRATAKPDSPVLFVTFFGGDGRRYPLAVTQRLAGCAQDVLAALAAT